MRTLKTRGLVPLFVLLAALAGCDGLDSATRPIAGAEETGASWSSSTSELKKVRGTPPSTSTKSDERTIGPDGGVLRAAGHTLTVPAGAVDKATIFRMSVYEDGHVGVRLTATSTNSKAVENDVGSAGFLKPVHLSLTYSWADTSDVTDPSALTVALNRTDGTLSGVSSSVDTANKLVSGWLAHFSDYVVAYPN